jgi:hypothetical protein
MKKLSLIALVLCAVCIFIWCEDNSSNDTFTFTLIMNKNGITDGTTAYAKFVQAGGDCLTDETLYLASATFSANQATATLKVDKGTYFGCAFIDVDNSSASEVSPLPEMNDWATDSNEDVIMNTNRTISIADDEWTCVDCDS